MVIGRWSSVVGDPCQILFLKDYRNVPYRWRNAAHRTRARARAHTTPSTSSSGHRRRRSMACSVGRMAIQQGEIRAIRRTLRGIVEKRGSIRSTGL